MSLADRVRARVSPDAAITNAAHRALLGVSTARVARRHDRTSRALSAALRSTGLGRFSPEERAWIARIEARRRRIISGDAIPEALRPPEADAEFSRRRPAGWSVAWAARYASVPRVWGRFMMRLVRELRPRSCLELGTAFGLSALYQAAGLELNGEGTLVTLDRQWSSIAREGLSELRLERRVEIEAGQIGETLGGVLTRIEPVDFAFIDAEHSEEATVWNFETMLPHLTNGAVVIVDDVLTSEEMKRAWEQIRRSDRVSLELGLRRFGIVVISTP